MCQNCCAGIAQLAVAYLSLRQIDISNLLEFNRARESAKLTNWSRRKPFMAESFEKQQP